MNVGAVEAIQFCVGLMLFAAAVLTMVRVVNGPSVLDRVVASDVMVSVIVCILGAYAAFNDDITTLPILISLSLIGFMGSVAVARFVARDRDYPMEPDAESSRPGGDQP